MSLPETLSHMNAVMSLLGEQLPRGCTAHIGVAPTEKTGAYVVLYPDTGQTKVTRLCPDRDTFRVRFWAHAIGDGPEMCMWAMDQTRNILDGSRPDVPGRTVQRITQTLGPQPMTRDLTLQPPKFLQVAEFKITSQGD